jgi:hypothetical protein
MLKVITISTHDTPNYELFKSSAHRHGIEFLRLGEGRTYDGHRTKILWLSEFLCNEPADSLILYTDSLDAFFLSNSDEILEKFRLFGAPLVFSAEQNLNLSEVSTWTKFQRYLVLMKNRPKPYRFLNAGGWIGEAGTMLQILDKIVALPFSDDQEALNFYFSENPNELVLDSGHQIFSCTAGRTGLELQDYHIENDRVTNQVTGSKPSIMHFAGNYFEGANQLVSQISYLRDYRYVIKKQDYRWYSLKNRLTDVFGTDNYRFHLIAPVALVLIAIVVIWTLFFLFS